MTAGPPRRIDAALIRVLLRAVLVVTASTQPVFVIGASFFQIGPEFGIGPVGLGALTASFFFTASVTSTSLGRWVQRVGWQRAMRVNMAASAVIMFVMAIAARGFWSMAGLLVAAASVYGMSNPASNLALSEHAIPRHRATLFGAKHAGIPASALLAGLAVPAVVVTFGWRWAIVSGAVLAAGVGLSVPRSELAPSEGSADQGEDVPTRPPMSTRWLLGLAAGSALATWAAIGLGTYMVSSAIAVGFSEAAAGWLQFCGAALSISARIGFGALTDRNRWSGMGGIVILASLGAVVFAILPSVTSWLFTVLVLAGYVTGWGWPGLMTFSVVDANRGSVASSSAITQAGVFIGAGAGPLILGYAIEAGSFAAAWYTVAAGLAGAALIIGVVRLRRDLVSV